MAVDDEGIAWRCISGKNPELGDCCQDDVLTGCGEGYECSAGGGKCVNVGNTTSDDPLILPRYRLCSIRYQYQRSTHYLPSGAAFLSSHAISTKGLENVEQLWIIVHGSGHNPDDYLCCSLALSGANSKIWIIAPWFLPSGSNTTGLKWIDHGPIAHTWRYGANAEKSNVSSYAVTDDLISFAFSNVPSLKKIVVAGHSAGGQYVQRWALLTQKWNSSITMRAVVANPKSYCWLDARRMFPDGFRRPNPDAIAICPTYNEWEWGFENSTGKHRESGALYTPYKDAALTEYTVDQIIARYLSRDVVYLAGELDVLWNGDCEARMQGDSRKARSENFFKSLSWQDKAVSHQRLVVKGVDHNHCLMFQSPEGREAFFGSSSSSVLDQ